MFAEACSVQLAMLFAWRCRSTETSVDWPSSHVMCKCNVVVAVETCEFFSVARSTLHLVDIVSYARLAGRPMQDVHIYARRP